MCRARSSNLWARIICSLMAVGLCVNTAAALSGSGTEQDPWLIQSLADFNDFAADANYWDDYTRLETDVNLAGKVYERAVIAPDVDDEESGFQGTAFTGVFDGNDHNITGLTIDNEPGTYIYYVGLFGYVDDGQVKNLGLEGFFVSVTGSSYIGGLLGFNNGSVSNCYSTGSVSRMGRGVGGLAGKNSGSISHSYSISDINGGPYIGGLLGINSGSISNCYSAGSVREILDFGGGLVGSNSGSISECYSTGDVSGDSTVGGLVGRNGGSISDCYSTGDVSGDSTVGGLVGGNGLERGAYCFTGSIANSYWDIQASGEPNMCGVQVDCAFGCNDSYGKTTAEMTQQSTFTDWDFINVWHIGENQTYPWLRQHNPSDLNKDRIVNFLDLCIVADQWMKEP